MRVIMPLSGSDTSAVDIGRSTAAHGPTVARVVVVSPMRIYREGLAHVLGQQAGVVVVDVAARIDEMAPLLAARDVDVVLFDLTTPGGLTALRQLASSAGVKVVVLGLPDDEGPILACARAGIAGYVTQDATLAELTQRIRDATIGEFTCSPQLAATLLRSLAASPAGHRPAPGTRLTPRECEIIGLIERGLSNKEIARKLTIQLATVKNHVHNILEKLSVRRRSDAVRAARSMESYGTVAYAGLPDR